MRNIRIVHTVILFFSLSFVPVVIAAPQANPAGKHICREAPGPEDTLQFKLTLVQDGRLKGSGSFSGARGILYFKNGSWRLKEGRIYAELILVGSMSSGTKMEKARREVKFDFMLSELLSSQGCFEPKIGNP